MYYFGILSLLTVFSINDVHGVCMKENSANVLTKIKEKMSSISNRWEYVALYQKMNEDEEKFLRNIFECEDDGNLSVDWDKLKMELLTKINKSCPDFKSSYEEIKRCRYELDSYNFYKDTTKYCSIFKKCSDMHGKSCPPLRESVLLENQLSNASVNFCTVECDDVFELIKGFKNCWASFQSLEKGPSANFETLSHCFMLSRKPTCMVTKEMVAKIFPLFDNKAEDILSKAVSEKPESKCIQEWNTLKKIEKLKPVHCRLLEDMRPCIIQFLEGDGKQHYKEKVAKCQYSVVNLIRTEALIQTTENPTSAPSTAAGRLGGSAYHLVGICGLMTMVTLLKQYTFQ